MLSMLLESVPVYGVDINRCHSAERRGTKPWRTLLGFAAEHNHVAVAKRLLQEREVDIDARDSQVGNTPLTLLICRRASRQLDD